MTIDIGIKSSDRATKRFLNYIFSRERIGCVFTDGRREWVEWTE